MHPYQKRFIQLCLEYKVLQFGEFKLKSGRISPYFFNAGLFYTGRALSLVGEAYAQAILENKLSFDMLFGPAYKGIPLVSATAIALNQNQKDLPYCFNRKEAKNHGEGGILVGAPLQGRVLIVDDVITAGTAIRSSLSALETSNSCLGGIILALDRQERGVGSKSAVQELKDELQIPVISIINLENLITYLKLEENNKINTYLGAMETYRDSYGIS
jgi:orotate phosphoribosyltransferase